MPHRDPTGETERCDKSYGMLMTCDSMMGVMDALPGLPDVGLEPLKSSLNFTCEKYRLG